MVINNQFTVCFSTYRLNPKLVKQVLATCTCKENNPENTSHWPVTESAVGIWWALTSRLKTDLKLASAFWYVCWFAEFALYVLGSYLHLLMCACLYNWDHILLMYENVFFAFIIVSLMLYPRLARHIDDTPCRRMNVRFVR